jgi:hypothetical protein
VKKYSHSKTPSSFKSVQWTAFFTLSIPNKALIVFGLKFLAISGSWGPQISLNYSTAFSYLTSNTIQGPWERLSHKAEYSGNTF